jgi:MFS family permease
MAPHCKDRRVVTPEFALISTVNFCLFLILSSWSLLPLFIVQVGGNRADVGLVMGSIGVTSLGSLPIVAPLLDRFGRKPFMFFGVASAGLSNLGYQCFEVYSPLMIGVRLVQGVGFAACFNACSAAIVDIIPLKRRVQGLGLFGASSSLAVALGPYLAERVILTHGFGGYFFLLAGFGLCGAAVCPFFRESFQAPPPFRETRGFFATALETAYIGKMLLAATFGAGFAAMQTFLPLFAGSVHLRAGPFFVSYGVSLLAVRVLLGERLDRLPRERLTLGCLIGYAGMLAVTPLCDAQAHIVWLGVLFGCLQGISYPTMMATMVDQSLSGNRGVVVGLFTGAFGVGINLSLPLWGAAAERYGLPGLYYLGAGLLFCAAVVYSGHLIHDRK